MEVRIGVEKEISLKSYRDISK